MIYSKNTILRKQNFFRKCLIENKVMCCSFRLQQVCLISVLCSIENVTEVNYFYDDFIQPCNASAASPFGKVFIPILYSLVFIVGFAGVSFLKCFLYMKCLFCFCNAILKTVAAGKRHQKVKRVQYEQLLKSCIMLTMVSHMKVMTQVQNLCITIIFYCQEMVQFSAS